MVHQQNINWTFEIYLFIFSTHTNQAFNQTRGNGVCWSAYICNPAKSLFCKSVFKERQSDPSNEARRFRQINTSHKLYSNFGKKARVYVMDF